jgi:hypothetical protein
MNKDINIYDLRADAIDEDHIDLDTLFPDLQILSFGVFGFATTITEGSGQLSDQNYYSLLVGGDPLVQNSELNGWYFNVTHSSFKAYFDYLNYMTLMLVKYGLIKTGDYAAFYNPLFRGKNHVDTAHRMFNSIYKSLIDSSVIDDYLSVEHSPLDSENPTSLITQIEKHLNLLTEYHRQIDHLTIEQVDRDFYMGSLFDFFLENKSVSLNSLENYMERMEYCTLILVQYLLLKRTYHEEPEKITVGEASRQQVKKFYEFTCKDKKGNLRLEMELLEANDKWENDEFSIVDVINYHEEALSSYASEIVIHGMVRHTDLVQLLEDSNPFKLPYFVEWYFNDTNYKNAKRHVRRLDYGRLLIIQYIKNLNNV